MCVVVSILGTRYADLDELIHSTLRLVFFITPIFWIPHQHVRGAYVDALLYLNPFYYFIEVVREPLLYGTIPWFEISGSRHRASDRLADRQLPLCANARIRWRYGSKRHRCQS